MKKEIAAIQAAMILSPIRTQGCEKCSVSQPTPPVENRAQLLLLALLYRHWLDRLL